MTLPGIDISYAQATTPPLGGYGFVFCRAGYGPANADTRWGQHSSAVRAAGKVLGAYWFWYDGSTAGLQASMFLSIAKDADLLALDYEGAAKDVAGAREFIALVQSQGRRIGLYHSASGFPDFGQDWNWVAEWGTTAPTVPYAFWQYQGSPLDLDRFNGNAAALSALVGGAQAGPIGGTLMLAPVTDRTPGTISTYANTTMFDEDGTSAIGVTVAATGVPSPFGTVVNGKALRAIYRSYSAGVWHVAFVGPVTGSFVPTVAGDCTAAVAAAVAPLEAKIAAAKADLG